MEHKHAKLRILSSALRNLPETWTWDFTRFSDDCGTAGCAIGLAFEMGFLESKFQPTWDDAKQLGMDQDSVMSTFYDSADYGVCLHEVTPEMVADAIDRYIEEN